LAEDVAHAGGEAPDKLESGIPKSAVIRVLVGEELVGRGLLGSHNQAATTFSGSLVQKEAVID
jgi:hypothetical protein